MPTLTIKGNNTGGTANPLDLTVAQVLAMLSPIPVTNGGTGTTTFTANGILIGNGTSAISQVSVGGAGTMLTDSGGAPSWTNTPTLGQNTVTTGALYLANGNPSGASVGIANQSATTSYVFYLPTSAGTSGQVLTSAGSNSTPTWTTPATTPTLTSLGIRSGQTTLASGITTKAVTFSSTLGTTSYAVTATMANTTDSNPAYIPVTITAASATGFTASWNTPLPTANYVLNWSAILNN